MLTTPDASEAERSGMLMQGLGFHALRHQWVTGMHVAKALPMAPD